MLQEAVAGLQEAVAGLACGPDSWFAASGLRAASDDVARLVAAHSLLLSGNLRFGGEAIAASEAEYQKVEDEGETDSAALGQEVGGVGLL